MSRLRYVLVALLVLAALSGWAAAWHLGDKARRSDAWHQAARLDAFGWQHAAKVAERKLGEALSARAAELAREAAETGADPVAAVRVITQYVPVPTPSDETMVGAAVDVAVAATADGSVFVTGDVQVMVGDVQVSPPAEVRAEVTGELRDALRAYRQRGPRVALRPRHPRHWRAGWSAGPALVIEPDGKPRVGVAVLWGVHF